MRKSIVILQSLFCLSVALSVTLAMIAGAGIADFNAHNEGWIEAGLAALLAVSGIREVVKC